MNIPLNICMTTQWDIEGKKSTEKDRKHSEFSPNPLMWSVKNSRLKNGPNDQCFRIVLFCLTSNKNRQKLQMNSQLSPYRYICHVSLSPQIIFL